MALDTPRWRIICSKPKEETFRINSRVCVHANLFIDVSTARRNLYLLHCMVQEQMTCSPILTCPSVLIFSREVSTVLISIFLGCSDTHGHTHYTCSTVMHAIQSSPHLLQCLQHPVTSDHPATDVTKSQFHDCPYISLPHQLPQDTTGGQ